MANEFRKEADRLSSLASKVEAMAKQVVEARFVMEELSADLNQDDAILGLKNEIEAGGINTDALGFEGDDVEDAVVELAAVAFTLDDSADFLSDARDRLDEVESAVFSVVSTLEEAAKILNTLSEGEI